MRPSRATRRIAVEKLAKAADLFAQAASELAKVEEQEALEELENKPESAKILVPSEEDRARVRKRLRALGYKQ